MKITVESTAEIVNHEGVRGRIWTGYTEAGVPVRCLICWVSPQTHDKDINDDFARELVEIHKPGTKP